VKQDTKLYHTQEFARLVGVTVRALHHYDRLGLLRPKQRSQVGYRLYAERDFARLEQIVVLKFLGMPLKQIKSLLAARWSKLLEGFTGGDPEIQKGLNKMWADQANWPEASLRAYKVKPEVQEFIMKAMRAGK